MTTIYDYMRRDLKERIASWTEKIMGGHLDNDRYKYMSGEVKGMQYALDVIANAERLDNVEDDEFGAK